MNFPEKQKSSGSQAFDLTPLLPEPVDFQGFFNRKNIKVRNHLYQRLRTFVVRAWGLEPQRIAAREPKSRMSANSIMPADIQVAAKQAAEKKLRPSVFG